MNTDTVSELPAGATPSGTKGRILVAALRAFARHGFYGTSIRTIADGAGINSATLYSHYASKEDILTALVTLGSEALLARIEGALARAETTVDKLDAIIRATATAHSQFPLLAAVTNAEFRALSPEAAVAATQATTASSALLREVLTQGRDEGVFLSDDAEVTARVLEGMALQIPRWVGAVSESVDEIADSFVAIARRIVVSTAAN